MHFNKNCCKDSSYIVKKPEGTGRADKDTMDFATKEFSAWS